MRRPSSAVSFSWSVRFFEATLMSLYLFATTGFQASTCASTEGLPRTVKGPAIGFSPLNSNPIADGAMAVRPFQVTE